MALANEVTVVSAAFAEAKARVASRQQDYDYRLNETLPNAEAQVVEVAEAREIFNLVQEIATANIKKNLSENRFRISLINQLQQVPNHINFGDAEANLRSAQRNVKHATAHLASAVESFDKVQHLAEPYQLTTVALKEALKNTPNINLDSVSVGVTAGGHPYIRWLFEGILMKPDRNKYRWINNGRVPEIKLQTILIEFDLQTNSVKIKPKRGESDLCVYKYSGGSLQVHPHILSGSSPCLGDWGSPLMEAMHDKDWAVAAGLLQMYLSNAVSGDSAGKNWWKGVLGRESVDSRLDIGTARCRIYNNEVQEWMQVDYIVNPEEPGTFIKRILDENGEPRPEGWMPHLWAVGDLVTMSQNSEYYAETRNTGTNPSGVTGKIITLDGTSVRVMWPDGPNGYRRRDLTYVEPTEEAADLPDAAPVTANELDRTPMHTLDDLPQTETVDRPEGVPSLFI